MNKINIMDLSENELGEELSKLGEKSYRARQIFRWLYKEGARSFDQMLDIPLELRQRIKDRLHITHLTVLDSKRSGLDGTVKYLFKLEDTNSVEAVFLPEKTRSTVCLSSQVGCKFGCLFCASASYGFTRNLKVSEILGEVIAVKTNSHVERVTNLVFMGIGEPFDNYDNVIKAIRILNGRFSFDIGARRITVSTCGVIPGIERFKKEGLQVELSVSLHSADDLIRSKLVPANKKYPLKDLIKACGEYTEDTGRIITFEYVLIEGLNASKEDALKLVRLLKGMKCKVNTILYNQIKAKGYSSPSRKSVNMFLDILKSGGINAIHRKSRGEDIDAGCGQLRISRL